MKTIVTGLFLILMPNASPPSMAQAAAASETVVAQTIGLKTFVTESEKVVEDAADWPVKPSQAALIAQEANPGSVVLSVKLLPSGEYAVTLKTRGSVQKVFVNATSGATG